MPHALGLFTKRRGLVSTPGRNITVIELDEIHDGNMVFQLVIDKEKAGFI